MPRLFKFIYDNIWQSAAQNRSEKEKEVIQTCSDGNACFELTHFLQSNNRFLSTAIDFTFHKPIWAKSLDTQPGKRLSHTSNVEMCYAKKTNCMQRFPLSSLEKRFDSVPCTQELHTSGGPHVLQRFCCTFSDGPHILQRFCCTFSDGPHIFQRFLAVSGSWSWAGFRRRQIRKCVI